MSKDFSAMEDSNRSANADIHTVSSPARRVLLQGGLSALGATLLVAVARRLRQHRGHRAADRFQQRSSDRQGHACRACRLRGHRHRRMGRAGGHRRQHAGMASRHGQQCRRPGGADGYAPRRHPLLPIGRQQHARLARDEPRVHRRRPVAQRWHGQLDRREDAQVAGRTRRGGDRGCTAGRCVADGQAVPLCAALHRLLAIRGAGAGRRACADEDRCRSHPGAPCSAR